MIFYLLCGTAAFLGASVMLYLARILRLVGRIRSRRLQFRTANQKPEAVFPSRPCKLMVVLGSGGHTAEMLTLVHEALEHMKPPTNIVYLVGATDTHSAQKAVTLHSESEKGLLSEASINFLRLPRAREVGQGWISSVFTTMKSVSKAMAIMRNERPDLVLCNGPGTSAVVAFCALLLRAWFGDGRGKVIYVESFARVLTLSLSGKCVYLFADRFIVQWESLKKYSLAEYYGRLC